MLHCVQLLRKMKTFLKYQDKVVHLAASTAQVRQLVNVIDNIQTQCNTPDSLELYMYNAHKNTLHYK